MPCKRSSGLEQVVAYSIKCRIRHGFRQHDPCLEKCHPLTRAMSIDAGVWATGVARSVPAIGQASIAVQGRQRTRAVKMDQAVKHTP